MTYDRLGRPKTRTDAAGLCTWTYDSATGQLKDEDYTTGPLATLGVHRTFDSLNRLGSVSVPSVLSVVNYQYDPASRLETISSGANSAQYTYVPNSPLVGTITFKDSGVTRLTTTKVYDNLNRLGSVTNTPSVSSVFSVVYNYNSANQRTQATRETNAYWQYSYDALGQVTSGQKHFADGTAVNGLDYSWSYDDIGNRKTSTTNSQITNYTANTLNQYVSRTVPGYLDIFGEAASEATVTVALNNGAPQPATRQGDWFFKQLTVDNSGTAQSPALKITGVKNLVGANSEDFVAQMNRNPSVPKTPEVFAHDADGNLTSDARWSYTWDAENRLVAMKTKVGAVVPNGPLPATARQRLEFTYDGQGRRISKKVYNWTGSTWTLGTSTRFLHDGWNMIAEFSSSALQPFSLSRSYVWGADLSGSAQGAGGVGGLLFSTFETLNPSTQTLTLGAHAPAFDGNGNVIGLVDMATGVQSATYDYNAFGETVQSDGVASETNHFRFSTKYTDDETGLLYYGFRYYNPSSGMWLSRDPIEENGGMNIYAMAGNDLLGRVDSLGLDGVLTAPTIQIGPTPGIPGTPDGPPLPPSIGLGGATVVTALGTAAVVTGTLVYKAYIEPAIDKAFDDSANSKPTPFPTPKGFDPKTINDPVTTKDRCPRHSGVMQAQAGPRGSQSFNRSVGWNKRTPLTLSEGRGILALLVGQLKDRERGIFYGAIIKASQWMTGIAAAGGTGPTDQSFYVRDYPGYYKTIHSRPTDGAGLSK